MSYGTICQPIKRLAFDPRMRFLHQPSQAVTATAVSTLLNQYYQGQTRSVVRGEELACTRHEDEEAQQGPTGGPGTNLRKSVRLGPQVGRLRNARLP